MTAIPPPLGRWSLPRHDPWSTPFAETLLSHLDLRPGLSILDVACGHGIPAFYLAEQVGPSGSVVALDVSAGQVARARAIQGGALPWLRFDCADVRGLSPDLPLFDRITGNLAVMFFRPDRPAVVRSLAQRLRPGGQLVLTFPSRGTFESMWQRIDREFVAWRLAAERERFHAYLAERPSAADTRAWLATAGLERICVDELPLEVATGGGQAFLAHPLLRGGFLDDVAECFEDVRLAEDFLAAVADDVASITPLVALRCVMAAWKPF